MTSVGVFPISIIVASSMAGVSLFRLPSMLAETGAYSWIGWVICILAILSIVLMFSELSAKFDGGGGPYEYIFKTYGKTVGGVMGYFYVAYLMLQLGAISDTLIQNTQIAFTKNIADYCNIIGYFFVYAHSFSFGASSILTNIIALLKFAPLAVVIVAGIPHITYQGCMPAASGTFQNPIFGIAHAVSMILFAFSGIEFGLIADTSKIHDPKKTISKALILGTLTGSLIFLLTQAVVWSICDNTSTSSIGDVAEFLFGAIGKTFISIAGILFSIGAANATIMTCKYLSDKMDENSQLPQTLNIAFLAVHYAIFGITPTNIIAAATIPFSNCIAFSKLNVIFFNDLFFKYANSGAMFNLFLELSDVVLAATFLGCWFAYNNLETKNKWITRFALISCLFLLQISCVGVGSSFYSHYIDTSVYLH